MIRQKHLFILIFLAVSMVSSAQTEEGTFTDPRDGQTYRTLTVDILLEGDVTIQRTWMAQNLNYDYSDSYCYKNEPAYCQAYGRLYTFKAAQAACPDGWRVPTIGDWNLLFRTFGGTDEAGAALQKGGDSGMELLLGGFGDPGNIFKNVGISGNYWDAEKKSDNTSGLISIQKGSTEIFHSIIGDWHRNSCRCIREY